MLVDKRPQKGQWLRTVKPPFFFTIDEQDHGWKTSNLVLSSQPHVFASIDLDLGQLEPTRVFLDQRFEFWCDQQTRHTPVRPQIDQDRRFV